MDVTAIIVTTNDCPACLVFKESYRDTVISAFNKLDVTVKEVKAPSRAGFPANTVPKFLTRVSFYPCIILMETKTLKESSQDADPDNALPFVRVFNGEITTAGTISVISVLRPPKYSLTKEDISRFVTESVKSLSAKSDRKLESKFEDKSEVSSIKCRGINPVYRGFR